VWWVSYRGEGKVGVDTIGVFEDDGTPRAKHPLLLDPSPKAHPLHIARGFALVGDDLYIANAWRRNSHVARYRRRGNNFYYAGIVVATKHVAAMVHPFDVELGDDGRLYVSCQDTNTVIAVLPKVRRPAAVAIHLRKKFPNGNFLPGTLVASAQGRLPEVGDRVPRDVPQPQGLGVVLDVHGRPRHSVRGIVVHRRHLYVADEAGDTVKVFEVGSGRLVARIKGKRIKKPVHLTLHGNTLYIGAAGTGSILAYDIPKETPLGKLKARVVIDGKLTAPSGFAIGPDGDLYVAERLAQRVRRFSREGKKKGTFIDGLPDMPEFLVHVPDKGVRGAPSVRIVTRSGSGSTTKRSARAR
jgi:DNA-binding beta-propeller fold protein YncE